jgi:hypothetical protein
MDSSEEKYDVVLAVRKQVEQMDIDDEEQNPPEQMRLDIIKAFEDRTEVQTPRGSIFFAPKDEVDLMNEVINTIQEIPEGSRVVRKWQAE